jgi:universal stress protein A
LETVEAGLETAGGKESMKTKSNLQVEGTPRLRINRILVPVDFSGSAGEALGYAVAMAKNMQARIVLLHVIEPAYAGAEPGMGYMPQQVEAQELAARKLMRDIAAEFIPRELFEKMMLRTGCPYHEITLAAQSLNAGLIVITTHGRTGLSHVLMGSTAERVVRHAHCPVLTVRRAEGHASRRIKPLTETHLVEVTETLYDGS